jgi:cysteine desulfurase
MNLEPQFSAPADFYEQGIYADYNATTPVAPEVLEASLPWLQNGCGNPSSLHQPGIDAALAVERARRRVARELGESVPESIAFTGGGSEAINLALQGIAWKVKSTRSTGRRKFSDGEQPMLVTFASEHKATLEAAKICEHRYGMRRTVLPVDSDGGVILGELEQCLARNPVALVAMMAANNEVGTKQPLEEVGQLCRKHGALFFCDAVQVFGKYPLNVHELQIDLLAISAHKLYALKGLGALYINPDIQLEPLIGGGGQEQGRRAGTENVAGIASLGAAVNLLESSRDAENKRQQVFKEQLWARLKRSAPGIQLLGTLENSLSGCLCVAFPNISGQEMVTHLSHQGIYCSSGSACRSHEAGVSNEPSHVLRAMGVERELANGAIRLGLGIYTRPEDVDRIALTCADVFKVMAATAN